MNNELKIEENSIGIEFIVAIILLTIYAIIIGFSPFLFAL
jgi:hypothetical protein